MKKVSLIAAAVAASLSAGVVLADDKVQQGWQVNGYGHLLYNVGESLDLGDTWEHRRDYRAAGAAFSGNPNQVEFTVTRGDNYDSGAWSKYVLKTEYGNHEGNGGRGFYTSSGGNEGHLQTGQLEFKEAYVELGDLSYFKEGTSIWAGQRYLNRQAGIITKEFWKQSSGIGGGIQYNNMGIALVSADAGDGACSDGTSSYNCKNDNLDTDGASKTMTSLDLYYYGAEALGGRFDFDLKYQTRKNVDQSSTAADDGLGLGVTYSRDYYGLDGWSLTALTYGKGIAATKGTNFGSWNGGWDESDESIFFTSYGVMNISENLQLGSEVVYWSLDNSADRQVWGQDDVQRLFVGLTPSYKVNDNFRIETVLTYANEALADGSGWGRAENDTTFMTATLASVFTVNADYFGRPQIKPYVTYMTSSDDGYAWSNDAKGNETRVGVEAEIWF
ncbi:carbohydrate porin [uncultured Vibrio sp.]|uniref:carbohydrate porin n=1 Tax=uncultured Vibrio sp. TaxID=114054 RepID=UPI0025D5BD62|nr:carbohydrate porin [uncultured Vibrio sp.]